MREKSTEARFPKSPRTYPGRVLEAITRCDAICEGEKTAREKTYESSKRKDKSGTLALFVVYRSGESRGHTKEEKWRNGAVVIVGPWRGQVRGHS